VRTCARPEQASHQAFSAWSRPDRQVQPVFKTISQFGLICRYKSANERKSSDGAQATHTREKIYAVAHFGKEGKSEPIVPKIGQEVLAENGPN
jgi:hypothetical protein